MPSASVGGPGRTAVNETRTETGRAPADAGESGVACVDGVSLLSVRVTALAVLDAGEHARRQSAQLAAVTDPAVLELLLRLPAGLAVHDPIAWAETAGQPDGVLARDPEAMTVTRLLMPPLAVADVLVDATAGREILAVQDASLFARFTRRWVILAGERVPERAVLEAKLCGVGILTAAGGLVVPADGPVIEVADAWDWMLREKVYRRWLTLQPPGLTTPGGHGARSTRFATLLAGVHRWPRPPVSCPDASAGAAGERWCTGMDETGNETGPGSRAGLADSGAGGGAR